MPLRDADDYAFDAFDAIMLEALWRNFSLLIFLRMLYIFDLLNWLNSLIAGIKTLDMETSQLLYVPWIILLASCCDFLDAVCASWDNFGDDVWPFPRRC